LCARAEAIGMMIPPSAFLPQTAPVALGFCAPVQHSCNEIFCYGNQEDIMANGNIGPIAKECVMKNDGDKASTWPVEHREVAKCVCVCVALLGVILAGLEVMTWRAALIASSISIVYVMLLTRHYTRGKSGTTRDANSAG